MGKNSKNDRNTLATVADRMGWAYRRLGSEHSVLQRDGGATLLVAFEASETILGRSHTLSPLSAAKSEELGCSQMILIAENETWFRDKNVYKFFDDCIDNEMFDSFNRVIFYGSQMCGYAAAAFSVAAPGATVIALAPAATLDPQIAVWDTRTLKGRRLDFTSRYGFAPDMLDAAKFAYVFYDPNVQLDARHAAQFARNNVSRIRCRHFGSKLGIHFARMGIVDNIIEAACKDNLSDTYIHETLRTRRNYRAYLRKLLKRTESEGHEVMAAVLCRFVLNRLGGPYFQKRFRVLREKLENERQPL